MIGQVPIAEGVGGCQFLQILVDDSYSIVDQTLLGAREEDEVISHACIVQARCVVDGTDIRTEGIGA